MYFAYSISYLTVHKIKEGRLAGLKEEEEEEKEEDVKVHPPRYTFPCLVSPP